MLKARHQSLPLLCANLAYTSVSSVACPLQQVAFFLPQLVQQLRGDDSGAVRQFLFDGAKRSRLFAHHLVRHLPAAH